MTTARAFASTGCTLLLAAGLTACADDANNFPTNSCADVTGTCVEVKGGDVAKLQSTANTITANTTIILGSGEFEMTNALTLRTAGVDLIGQGMDETTLDYGTATAQVNGIDVQGDGFLVQDLGVVDSPKDGIRVEASNGVVFRRIRATWTTPSDPTNGAYGIYPVKSKNVLVEDSRAENASDAGLYVGQCEHVIVRNNVVNGNVAGLEIENVAYADVYGNTAENNTGGIMVFDMPGNPIVGRDVRMHNNIIKNNNHDNFAPGGTVQKVPPGTGTFALATRRVEITDNTYENNQTVDIALLSGLALESNTTLWEIPTATMIGTWNDLGLLPGAVDGTVTNFRTENILVARNTHTGSGQHPAASDPLMLGLLLILSYPGQSTDSILYDSIGEPNYSSTDAAMNSNFNHVCVGGNTGGTFASMNLAVQSAENLVPFFRPAAPFAPFNCLELANGPVAAVVLP